MLKKIKKVVGKENKKHAFHKEEAKKVADFLSVDQKYWVFSKARIEDAALAYGFQFVNLSSLTQAAVYLKNKDAEDVKKRLVSFSQRFKSEEPCLRLETLPQIFKFYIHSRADREAMAKIFYLGSVFSREKDKKGTNLVENSNFSFESIGPENASAEAEIINLVHSLVVDLGLKVSLKINNIGCAECRPLYWQQLDDYYKNRKRYLCDDCKSAYSSKSLAFLNCDKANCQELSADAPQLVDFLCESCRQNFVKVLEYLDEAELPYVLDPKMFVNPETYYKTIFSIEAETGKTVLIGGRHDKLLEKMGEKGISAFGFEANMEKIVDEQKKNNFTIPDFSEADVFLAHLGEEAKKKSLRVFDELKKNNIRVMHAFNENSLNRQLALATKYRPRIILIFGQREMMDKTILIRDVDTGSQEVISRDRIIEEIKRRLKKLSLSSSCEGEGFEPDRFEGNFKGDEDAEEDDSLSLDDAKEEGNY